MYWYNKDGEENKLLVTWSEEKMLILQYIRCYSGQKGIGGKQVCLHTEQSWVLSQTITEHKQRSTTNKKQANTQTSTFSALYIEEGPRHSTGLVADLSSAIWFTVWPSESLLCLQIPAPTNKLEILKPSLQNWFKIYEDVSTIWCLIGSH